MTTVFDEGSLRLDFSGCLNAEHFDQQGQERPEGMKAVDYVVEETERLLLVELKDPSDPQTPPAEREKFLERMKTKEMIYHELVPKARDSYCYLHLMKRDSKPCVYLVCIGSESLSLDPALLMNFKGRLLARLKQETDEPWVREYVGDCIVVTIQNWATYFPKYKIARITPERIRA
jgi:hypothetical protein